MHACFEPTHPRLAPPSRTRILSFAARRSASRRKSVQLPLQLTARSSPSSNSAQEPGNKQKCAASPVTHSAQFLEQA